MKKLLSEKIADSIAEMISNDYKSGERIPNETDLALKFNVSRTTVREAIKILCSKNVLEVRRGNGTFICDNPGLLQDPFGWKYINDTTLLIDLFEMGFLVEPSFAYLACKKVKPELIERIEKEHELFVKNVERYQEYGDVSLDLLSKQDKNFHRMLIDCIDNQVISRVHPVINDLYKDHLKCYDEFLDSCVKCHRLIIDAMKSKDAVMAKNYMKLHITEMAKILFGVDSPIFENDDDINYQSKHFVREN